MIGFQWFEDMPPWSIVLGYVELFRAEDCEQDNSSHPLSTSTNDSAPSPSSVSAAITRWGLNQGRLWSIPFLFPFPCICLDVSHPVSARQLISRSGDAFLDQVCHIGFSITLRLWYPVPMITAEFVSRFGTLRRAMSMTSVSYEYTWTSCSIHDIFLIPR